MSKARLRWPLGIFVDAAHAGSKAAHLPVGGYQQNQLADQHLALGAGLSPQVPNPFFGIVDQGILQSPTDYDVSERPAIAVDSAAERDGAARGPIRIS